MCVVWVVNTSPNQSKPSQTSGEGALLCLPATPVWEERAGRVAARLVAGHDPPPLVPSCSRPPSKPLFFRSAPTPPSTPPFPSPSCLFLPLPTPWLQTPDPKGVWRQRAGWRPAARVRARHPLRQARRGPRRRHPQLHLPTGRSGAGHGLVRGREGGRQGGRAGQCVTRAPAGTGDTRVRVDGCESVRSALIYGTQA